MHLYFGGNMFIEYESDNLKYMVEKSDEGMKLIDILATKMYVSSRLIRKSKSKKNILLNGRNISVNALVRKNDIIEVIFEKEKNIFEPENIDIDVLYEDVDVLIINKQPFIVVHPTKGHPTGTIGNGISKYFIGNGDNRKIRFINRLDRDTSGIMMVAKNGFSQKSISKQMTENLVEKNYIAIVEGVMESDSGTINLPIEREFEGDIVRKVLPDGLPSITHYKVLERFDNHTFVKIVLETGRTHQIRVHFSHLGHPLAGDVLYGGSGELIKRQALHCDELTFFTPRDNKKINITTDIPGDIKDLIFKLRG